MTKFVGTLVMGLLAIVLVMNGAVDIKATFGTIIKFFAAGLNAVVEGDRPININVNVDRDNPAERGYEP